MILQQVACSPQYSVCVAWSPIRLVLVAIFSFHFKGGGKIAIQCLEPIQAFLFLDCQAQLVVIVELFPPFLRHQMIDCVNLLIILYAAFIPGSKIQITQYKAKVCC